MNPGLARKSIGLKRLYTAALQQHLTRGTRKNVRSAGKLGREVLAAGLETSGLAKIHEQAMTTLVSPSDSARINDAKIKRATSFVIEALASIGSHPNATEVSNDRMRRLNGTMRRRTIELTDAKRRLKRESARRKSLEASLKKSEQYFDQLLKRSRRMQEHLRRLSHEILSAQEQERKKISRELHDEIGQILTAVNVKLATLKKEATATSKEFKRAIGSTQRLVERSMNTVHRFARNLRPPVLDDLGLIPALHSHMKSFTKQTHVPVRFRTFAALEQLDSDKRTVLYRVAQEAFANIAKHARASLVSVRIQRVKGLVRMEIHDNGRSFDAKRLMVATSIVRLGLLGMRERVEMVGGSFEVESTPGHGTTIRAQLPFPGRERS